MYTQPNYILNIFYILLLKKKSKSIGGYKGGVSSLYREVDSNTEHTLSTLFFVHLCITHTSFFSGPPPRSVKCSFDSKVIKSVHYFSIVFVQEFGEEKLRHCVTLVPGWTRGDAACLKLSLHCVHVPFGAQVDPGLALVRSHDDCKVRTDDVGEGTDIWDTTVDLFLHPSCLLQDGPAQCIQVLEGCAHQVDPLLERAVLVVHDSNLW